LSGRDLWIERQIHMMVDSDEDEPDEADPEDKLDGYELFKYRTAHALEQSLPDPEKATNQHYQQHLDRLRALNQRRRERGERVIPFNAV
jgi:hypothetical protein